MIQKVINNPFKRILINSKYLLLICLLLCSTWSWSQERTINGIVVDADTNEPLVGATIVVKGTSTGNVTDFDGAFQIKVNSNDAILVITYIGYVTQEIPVGTQTALRILLKQSSESLDEVVVVGYGTQKKVNISGSVSTVDMKKLDSRPTANISQGLQGTVANLNITMPSGEPGGSARINIRGFTSINGGKPLILIDEVPSSEADLTRLNPEDVKSVTVLKDASSAAIYGARAAFGVLLITTKSGGSSQVTYSSNYIWGQPTITPDPITDPYIFSRLLDISTNNTPWDYVNYSDETYAWARARSDDPTVPNVRLNPHDPTRYEYMGDNNWNDFFFNKSTFSQNQNISMSGKKDAISYYVSANHTKENGLNRLAEDAWKRNAIRAKLQIDPYKWMRFENNTFLSSVNRDRPTYGITNVYNLRPTDVAKNPDGTWANTPAGHAAARMIDGGKANDEDTDIQTTNKLDLFLFNKDLTITAQSTIKRAFDKSHWDATKYKIGYGPNDVRENSANDYAYESSGENKYSLINIYGTYNKSFDKHSISVVAGYNQEENKYEWFDAQVDDLISSGLPNMELATGERKINWFYSDWAVRGIFGRFNYIYNDKYIVEFNGRYDESSRFPKSNRGGLFPSVSAAWILSKEPFMQPVSDVINHLKIKISHGSLGNQNVGNYGYINSMPVYDSSYLIDGEYPKAVGAETLFVDPSNYTWEKVETNNIGLELGFFDSTVNIAADYYIRNTIGMLTAGQELPGVLGTSVPASNAADLETKGWEFTMSYQDQYQLSGSPLDMSMSLVLSDNQSKITKFENDGELFSQWREGAQVGEIWGLENDGFFATQEEIDNLDESAIVPWGSLAIVPGWPKYVDQDGDGRILRGQSANDPKDLKLIGNSQARYRVGFNMNLRYKGFDLSGFLQGVMKRDYYPVHYLFWGPYQQPYANMYPHLLDFYRGSDDSEALRAVHSQSYIDAGLADANTTAEYPVMQSWLADVNTGQGLSIPQSKYLMNAAYLRLKNLTFGYTLPEQLTDKFSISKLRLFFTGENLYEWSEIKDHIDPEATGQRGYAYPFHRKFSLGVQLTF